jgi:hypothetical protein
MSGLSTPSYHIPDPGVYALSAYYTAPRIIDGACPKCMAIACFVRHRYEDEMRDKTCTTTGRLSVVIGWLGWSGVSEVSVSILATPFIDI